MVRFSKTKTRSSLAVNASIASTNALIQQALHDKYQFNKGRFQRIEDKVEAYSYEIEHDTAKFASYRQRLEEKGIDKQSLRDFIRGMQRALKVSGKSERTSSEAATEYTYTLVFLAIADLFKFGRERLRWLQQKIKFYIWCVLDGDVMLPEFIKCMAVECGQDKTNIQAWENQFGELKIYG